MAASTSTSTVPPSSHDPTTTTEWELVNDDGLVYKRKRRRRPSPYIAARPQDSVPDPDLEAKQKKTRKRKALLNVKERYTKEISMWELLSNTLRASAASEEKEKEKEKEKEGRFAKGKQMGSVDGVRLGEEWAEVVDGVLRKVEAQEAVIAHLMALCDAAEALCHVQEEKLTQSVLQLPIWRSPRELMAALCED